jgi:hypothetical protein
MHPLTADGQRTDSTDVSMMRLGDTPIMPVRVPGRHGDRVIGSYVAEQGQVRWIPAVDVDRLARHALGVAALVVVAAGAVAGLRGRPGPAVRSIRMGPGGWVSFKRSVGPMLRTDPGPAHSRPLWARALGAHRLMVERRPGRCR